MRYCKFGTACRLIPHCLYRHPSGAVQMREVEKQIREKHNTEKQFQQRPACPREDGCPDKHVEDPQEIAHWVQFFGERPCEFGTSCRLVPHCLHRHPQVVVPEMLEDARAQGKPLSGVVVLPPNRPSVAAGDALRVSASTLLAPPKLVSA